MYMKLILYSIHGMKKLGLLVVVVLVVVLVLMVAFAIVVVVGAPIKVYLIFICIFII